MTTKPANSLPGARRLPPLPDPPRKTDMQEYTRFDMLAEANTLARRFDAQRADSSILVSGKGYLCRRRSDLPRAPYPDLVVAFDVDAAAIVDNNGYDISEVGKPPELVLEIASSSTGKNDYIGKRVIYAGFWRAGILALRRHRRPLPRRASGRRPPYPRRGIPADRAAYRGQRRNLGLQPSAVAVFVLGGGPSAVLGSQPGRLPVGPVGRTTGPHRRGRPGRRSRGPGPTPKPPALTLRPRAPSNWRKRCAACGADRLTRSYHVHKLAIKRTNPHPPRRFPA